MKRVNDEYKCLSCGMIKQVGGSVLNAFAGSDSGRAYNAKSGLFL